jgi:hypothetical protein
MQRIKDWINEPREGWYHGRRVALTSNLYNDAIHYQFTVQDFDARVDGIGCSTVGQADPPHLRQSPLCHRCECAYDPCPPTLRDPGLPPTARDGCAGAAGDAIEE